MWMLVASFLATALAVPLEVGVGAESHLQRPVDGFRGSFRAALGPHAALAWQLSWVPDRPHAATGALLDVTPYPRESGLRGHVLFGSALHVREIFREDGAGLAPRTGLAVGVDLSVALGLAADVWATPRVGVRLSLIDHLLLLRTTHVTVVALEVCTRVRRASELPAR